MFIKPGITRKEKGNGVPSKFYDYAMLDNLVLEKHPEAYHKTWQKRCDNCLAPCCFFSIGGKYYNFSEINVIDEDKNLSSKFWTNDFVIIDLVHISNVKLMEDWGFNMYLDFGEEKGDNRLQICPLSINSTCLIYEDHPKMCKIFKCDMKMKEGWSSIE